MGKKRRISEIKMLNKIQETYNFNEEQIAYELAVTALTVRSWFEGGTDQQHNYIKLKKLYNAARKEKITFLDGIEMIQKIIEKNGMDATQLANELELNSYTVQKWLRGGKISNGSFKKIRELYKSTFEDTIEENRIEYANKKEFQKVVEKEKSTEIDLFDDVKKIHYSLKLKEAFGLSISNILTNFDWWIKENERNKKNYYDGYYWHVASIELMYENWFKYSFPEIKIFEEQIEQLVKNGVVIKINPTNFNVCDTYFWRIDKERLYGFYKHIKK